MDLVGERVRLRAPSSTDAEPLLAIRSHPEVARFAGSPSMLPSTLDRIRQSLPRRSADYIRWVVECREDLAVVGSAVAYRLDFRNRNGWLAVELGPPARWGRGYGTESLRLVTRFAFRQLGLEKVYVGALEGNERALRACRRAGYEVEAALERHHLLEGRLVTEYWLAAFRDSPLYAERHGG